MEETHRRAEDIVKLKAQKELRARGPRVRTAFFSQQTATRKSKKHWRVQCSAVLTRSCRVGVRQAREHARVLKEEQLQREQQQKSLERAHRAAQLRVCSLAPPPVPWLPAQSTTDRRTCDAPTLTWSTAAVDHDGRRVE
eukprot:3290360-Rhodomonas_salina.3